MHHILQMLFISICFFDLLCQRDVVQQLSIDKASTLQKMLDQVIQEYEVSNEMLYILL